MNKFLTIIGLYFIITSAKAIFESNYFFNYWLLLFGCWLFISSILEELERLINNNKAMNETQKAISELLEPYLVEYQTAYDITAVLKYIKDKCKYTEYGYDDIMIDNLYIHLVHISYGEEFRPSRKGYTFNKPTHLYNDQEEKELLELLIKLK